VTGEAVSLEGEVVTVPCGAQAYCGYDDEAECKLRAGHLSEWHEETRWYPAHHRDRDTDREVLDEVVIRWRREVKPGG
jgi:hypothetical protein